MFNAALNLIRQNRPLWIAGSAIIIGLFSPSGSIWPTVFSAAALLVIYLVTQYSMRSEIRNAQSHQDAIKALSRSPKWIVVALVVMVFLVGARLGYQESRQDLLQEFLSPASAIDHGYFQRDDI